MCGDAHNQDFLCEKCDEEQMVCCDHCNMWMHIGCLKLDSDDLPEEGFLCPFCEELVAEEAAAAKKSQKRKKKKKVCPVYRRVCS